MDFRAFLKILWMLAIPAGLASQSVSISPEIYIKNDFAYYVLSHPDGTTSLLRDKSFRLILQTLRSDFSWSAEKSIELKGNKWRILEVLADSNDIDIFYISRSEEHYVLMKSSYSAQGELLDQRELFSGLAGTALKEYSVYRSSNEQWVGIRFEDVKGEDGFLLFHRGHDSTICMLPEKQLLGDGEDAFEFLDLVLSNAGSVFVYVRQQGVETKKHRLGHSLLRFDPPEGPVRRAILPLESGSVHRLVLRIDDRNHRALLAGLYAENPSRNPQGYLFYAVDADHHVVAAAKIPYSEMLTAEWKGNIKDAEWREGTLKLRDVVLTHSGGGLLLFEHTREMSRRPYFSTIDPGLSTAARWYDFYFDDILAVSLDVDGRLLWERVLRKRQYSQDDDGIFSSFYTFRTEALLRLIFNDAVQSEGTVSEYLLKPNGDNIRKSVLNTSYKNLSLRFRDAISLDAQKLLVPSEHNGKLRLVRIAFD
ncbi:MAG: hypothetical protein JPMHGGIA_00528 [Saprospiraceae bacterium]|nr:hypothetical protein [Saprospiraceae bacterium]